MIEQALRALRLSEWIVLAATIATGIWAWFAYMVTVPQDAVQFLWVFGIALTAGSLIQAILFVLVRPPGTLRERLMFTNARASLSGSWIVILAPAVVIGLVLLVATPPSTSGAAIDPDFSIYQVIAITVILALLFTSFGAGLIMVLVVVPIAFLLAAVLPAGKAEEERSRATGWTRPQLAIGGAIILSAIGFALSISAVATGAGSSMRDRMRDQFLAFITLDGNIVATLLTWVFIAALIVLVVVNNRIEARKRRAPGP